MPAIDLIIFDCDGVLVDSEIVAARVESELLRKAGHDISPEELTEGYSGLTFKDILLTIEREAQVLFQATLIDKVETMIDERLAREVKAIEGVAQVLATLKYRKCICSNSTRHRIEASLKRAGLIHLFAPSEIFSSVDTPGLRPKPAPDVFLHAAKEMGADPKNTIVIEDSMHGIAGARAAGMRIIGFTGASHTHPRHADMLMEAGAETTVSRMSDLKPTIEALAEWSADI